MEVQTEISYVVRMSRLDAAKTLVDPNELQMRLRACLGDSVSVIEGATVTPALTDGGNGHATNSQDKPTPFVKRAMLKLKKSAKKTYCPICNKSYKGIGVHNAMRHGKKASSIDGTTIQDEPDAEVERLTANVIDQHARRLKEKTASNRSITEMRYGRH